jgi:hypothetical protein
MRNVSEWVATTSDAEPPRRVKVRIFDLWRGRCAGCGRKLRPGDRWDCDHILAICNGGENREKNLQPVCLWCHARKTSLDVAIKSGVYERRASHIGVRKPRTMRTWRRFDGTIVNASRER